MLAQQNVSDRKEYKSIPKPGEIRMGYVPASESNTTHKYTGLRPYLIISNETYNKYSGQCEAIPFTTRKIRMHKKKSPSHVDYNVGEVVGLEKPSTLIIEARDTLKNVCFGEPIGHFSSTNWGKARDAFFVQNPFLKDMAISEPAITATA